jgi:hypothetical protein
MTETKPSPVDQHIMDHAATGGSTVDPRTGESLVGKRLWAVGAAPEAAMVSTNPPTHEELAGFAAMHQSVFDQHPNAHIGTAHDPETGLHHTEIVAVTPSKNAALDAATQFGENHIYNLATDEKVPTGHQGDRPTVPESISERFQALRDSSPPKQPFSGVHYSDAKLDFIDGSRRGTSGVGQENSRLRGNDGDAPAGFYVYKAGTLAEPQLAARKNAYPVRGNFAFADAATDPTYAEAYNTGGPNSAERALQDQGYDGYYSSKHPGIHFIFGSHQLAPTKPTK